MDRDECLNVAGVKAATNKKPYIKPDFEVINLEDTPILLSSSVDASTTSRFRTISRETW